jgi:predicted nucleic acid-binding protein
MPSRLYVDANILIYLVEGRDYRKDQAQKLLAQHTLSGTTLHSSEMIVGECLRGAWSHGEDVVHAYNTIFFSGEFMQLHAATLDLIKRAAALGAELNMKLVDAIHVATAEALECSVFLTNDRGTRTPAGMEIHYLSAEA